MRDADRMQVLQRARHTPHHVTGLSLTVAAFADDAIEQLAARQQVHHHPYLLFTLEHLYQLYAVRVVDLVHDLNLVVYGRQFIGIQLGLFDYFDCVLLSSLATHRTLDHGEGTTGRDRGRGWCRVGEVYVERVY